MKEKKDKFFRSSNHHQGRDKNTGFAPKKGENAKSMLGEEGESKWGIEGTAQLNEKKREHVREKN